MGREGGLANRKVLQSTQFTPSSRQSALNRSEYIEASKKDLRLTPKAQARWPATIVTKKPPLAIAKQASISTSL